MATMLSAHIYRNENSALEVLSNGRSVRLSAFAVRTRLGGRFVFHGWEASCYKIVEKRVKNPVGESEVKKCWSRYNSKTLDGYKKNFNSKKELILFLKDTMFSEAISEL